MLNNIFYNNLEIINNIFSYYINQNRYINSNYLSGSIPESIGNLTNF